MAPPFINIYETEQVYGGPEEGGWWYTAGEAVRSVPASTMKDAQRAFRLVSRVCDRLNSRRTIGQAMRRSDFIAVIERRPGQNYPLKAPRYE